MLGVGAGEALNEQILRDPWPNAEVRLAMLDEVVDVIRLLREGPSRSHHGAYHTVENACVYTLPDADLPAAGREAAGNGPAQGGIKVRHAPTVDEGLDTAHRTWPNEGLLGELAQVLLRPEHIEQASTLVTHDVLSLPDPKPYAARVRPFADAGFDEVYVAQIGLRQNEFFRLRDERL